jgi:erythromycin esterase
VAALAAGLGDEDLAPISRLVHDAKVIALGESWHSSTQLLLFKNRLVRYLVRNHGFDVVAFEGGVPGSPDASAYVAGGPGSAELALRQFGQPMWLNPESAELVDWLRAQNVSRAAQHKIEVIGIDPAYPGAAIGSMLAFMERVDAQYEIPARDLLERVAHSLLDVELTSTSKSAVWGATAVYESLDLGDRARLLNACDALLSRLARYGRVYSHLASPAQFEWAYRQAVVLLQALSITSVRTRSLTEANIARDLAFAVNLMGYLDNAAPSRKAIVIAHNIHVAREPFFSAPGGAPIASMGAHLAQWLGDRYVAIGSAVGRGAGKQRGLAAVPVDQTAKYAAANASNDAALEEVGVTQFVLPTAHAPEWAATPRLMRSHLEPQPQYGLRKSFDAVAYVDCAERCGALDVKA